MGRLLAILKRLVVGRPLSTHTELGQRVSKRVALAVFSSDALSSSAYATDVMMVSLAAAGTAALANSLPIAFAVVVVLVVVIVSYRTTVVAYPEGGGGYRVTTENLGHKAGVLVASALLVDYVLTVAVSVAAGMKALGVAVPAVATNRVGFAVAAVVLITLANLRGVREAGTAFSIPTYGFLIAMGTMLVLGTIQVVTGVATPPPPPRLPTEQSLTFFLILAAFARGSTALTGVEAIANAAPNFRPPEGPNAAKTLLALGILLSILFFGITFLANAFNVDPTLAEAPFNRPVPSQIAEAVFGVASLGFYLLQAFTALILFLAANTAYAGFPSLASVLAKDRILPRVLKSRGDKLAHSNGIAILAAAAIIVLFVFDANELRIIPLYVVGVFIDFTLSQTGLVVRWFRLKTPRWRRKALLNGFGAVVTLVVLLIQAITKIPEGAYIVIILIPLLAWLLYGVRRHYLRVRFELTTERPSRIASHRAILLASSDVGATIKAMGFARGLDARVLRVLAFRVAERHLRALRKEWSELDIADPIEATGHRVKDLVEFVRDLQPSASDPVTLVLPDVQFRNPLRQLIAGRLLLRVKGAFLNEPGVVVASIPFASGERAPKRIKVPERTAMLVVVSRINHPTMKALEYGRSLNPTLLRAINISIDPEESAELQQRWHETGVDVPLEIIDSPYRSILEPLLDQIRSLRPSPSDAIGVIIPEFVIDRWWRHALHGQTALLIKTALLFEPNVVVIDVTYPVGSGVGETRTKA